MSSNTDDNIVNRVSQFLAYCPFFFCLSQLWINHICLKLFNMISNTEDNKAWKLISRLLHIFRQAKHWIDYKTVIYTV